ncbi:MAG: YceH family protein [Burkholderiales bacterium]|nr:YceH family protein [Burkholderiales bacterium]
MPEADDAVLDPFEIRVLAVLAEKEALTPDNYPLSLNSLTNGCNQVSSREPVMSISEQTVADILQRLMQKKLVAAIQQAGARVVKYEHRMRVKWVLEQDKLAPLVVLMLRGLQTAGEIRSRSGRIHEFASLSELERSLQFLIDKYPPLVVKLPLAPGTKEARYGHTLGGEDALKQQEMAASYSASVVSPGAHHSQLEQEVVALRAEVAELRQQFEVFKKQFE